ncbi:MAG: ribonuclease PH [Candidatus Sericytochromatia bacterium]|nr:ribonuclease PH [Candidatus Sericytochromatia bacterium]
MASHSRIDGRACDALRPFSLQRGYTRHAEGSVLVCAGETRVLVTVSVEDKVPPFLRQTGQGWLTAEYALLPRSTHTRTQRESAQGRVGGRTHEIQRLIGRSLRACVDLSKIGERTLQVDCDVLQADGGTRTAAITGAYVAVVDALRWLKERKLIGSLPIIAPLAAVSVGVVDGVPMLDLCYEEDSRAGVDMNVVALEGGRFVEVQATAEGGAYDRALLDQMLALAGGGIESLLAFQREALGPLELPAVPVRA